MEDRVSVKYELFYEGSEERVGRTDRVEVTLSSDAELVAISLREAVHERRRVRDLAHCSAANLTLFTSNDTGAELQDEDLLSLLLEGTPERLRVQAPPPTAGPATTPSAAGLYKVSGSGTMVMALPSPHPSGTGLATSRSRSSSAVGRSSGEYTAVGALTAGPGSYSSTPRRESSGGGPKRGETDSVVVFVKTGDATFPVEVERSASVEAVRARIKEQERIPLHQQRLIYMGEELDTGRSLSEYNIHDGCEIQLMLTLGASS